MFRIISYATQQTTTSKDMSFLRRLIDYSRYILRNHQILLGRRKVETNKGFRIEGRGFTTVVENVNAARASSELGGLSSTGSTWQKIGQQIHSQVRQIFINNVLRRATTNQEVARKAAQRLMYGDSRPFFALVGVSLATGIGHSAQDSEFDGICWEIRESIIRQKENEPAGDNITQRESINSIQELQFGPILNQGCNAAVYSANFKDSKDSNWALAVKMLFNYDIESNAFAILKGMVKEIVPARHIDLKHLNDLDMGLFANVRRCPPHQNIIDVQHAFVDNVPLLPEALKNYPSALPRRLNPDDGFGRNMSLFLIMKRYDASLQEYLKTYIDIPYRTRLLVLTQILSGIAHLEQNQIAHRDLKTDNILVDLSQGHLFPEVVIADFGCCLADKTHGLSLPFRTYDTDRGGNPALTAPEISTAVPGTWKSLNYKKSDAWTIGCLAYEIFGNRNPFYQQQRQVESCQASSPCLDSRTYNEEELPFVNGVSLSVQKLIQGLLRRNPNQRLSAEKAFNICICIIFMPSEWMSRSDGRYPSDDEILQWLVCLTAKALCHANQQLEFNIMRTFLRKVKFSTLKLAVTWMIETRKE